MRITPKASQARRRLLDFVHKHHSVPQDFSGRRLDEKSYPVRYHEGLKAPKFTSFSARYDTLVYGQLLTKAAKVQPSGAKRIIDLGAGSCIPTLMALSDNPTELRLVDAIELDETAVPVGKDNAQAANFLDRYRFFNISIFDYLDAGEWPVDLPLIVGANPPYVPCVQEGKTDLLAINGGADGTRFLEAILNADWPTGTVLALQWSSLTTPDKMIQLVESGFDVKGLIATYVSSRTYTSSSDVNPYLLDRHNNGKAVFFFDRGDAVQYMIIGTVLVKK